jgi:hypothetical protein
MNDQHSNVVEFPVNQVVFRQVHLTEPVLHMLGAHALTLPEGSPARAGIRLMLHRANRSPRFVPKIDVEPEQMAA